jgi:hypothetical protein
MFAVGRELSLPDLGELFCCRLTRNKGVNLKSRDQHPLVPISCTILRESLPKQTRNACGEAQKHATYPSQDKLEYNLRKSNRMKLDYRTTLSRWNGLVRARSNESRRRYI